MQLKRTSNKSTGTFLISLACLILFIAPLAMANESHQDDHKIFNRIATFPTFLNTSEGDETVAEIVSASEDGNTLVYTDSETEKVGFVDITDPENPVADGTVDVGGEPTSVAVTGNWALVGVNTSPNLANPAGHLAVIDMTLRTIVREIDLNGQPDSVATSPNGAWAAVAIENERDEDIFVDGVEGGLPQLPAGFLVAIETTGAPATWTTHTVDLTGLAGVNFPTDPEPEFVDINQLNIATVTLQENNAIVLVHLPTQNVLTSFNVGNVDLANIDIEDNSLIQLNSNLNDVDREPDAISWLFNYFMVTANEGDLNGGSRGFSIFDPAGNVRYDSGVDIEHLAVQHGHYPEDRADNKGAEPEGIEVARYGHKNFIFVGSERGNFVAVYRVSLFNGLEFVQLLPTGVGPEGLLAIPSRNLFVVAAEVDDADEGFRSTLSIYRLEDEKQAYPTIVSNVEGSPALPVAWGALSGLAADENMNHILYAVQDSFYDQSSIFAIDASQKPAVILKKRPLKDAGSTVNLDLEGIAIRKDGGFWLVSEGSGEGDTLNLLLRTDDQGNILETIELPASVNAQQVRFGFEGVTSVKDGGTEVVYVAFQREWKDDPAGLVRIGEYRTDTQAWRFFHYPLDVAPAGGWVGLSEIVAKDDETFWVIERDNQQGTKATVKKIYEFSVTGITPEPQGTPFPVIRKAPVHDLLPDLQAPKGWVLDKVEGLTISKDGDIYVVTDNDGVDDALGETQFFSIGNVEDF